MAVECAATDAELDVGHGTVWVNDYGRYIAMEVREIEVLKGARLTDSMSATAQTILCLVSILNGVSTRRELHSRPERIVKTRRNNDEKISYCRPAR